MIPLDIASIIRLCLKMRGIGRFDLNYQLLQQVYAHAPNIPDIQRSWGLALCRSGDLAQGLKIYEQGRRQLPQFSNIIRPFSHPLWNGKDLRGKSLLLWAEQGIGDQLMQARCITDLSGHGADITFECDPRLHPLLERSYPNARSFSQLVEPLPGLLQGDFDYQCSALIAWCWLYPKIENCHSSAVWMKTDGAMVRAYKNTWQQQGWHYNIGLSWNSKAKVTGERKSLAPEDLAPLLGDSRCQYHSLQYGVSAQELVKLKPRFGRRIMIDRDCDARSDINRLAAQIAALDLVISIDNTTVHIAGAVGTPCWVILPCDCDWRWGSVDSTTSLYRDMRLFRQSQPGDWQDVVIELQLALAQKPFNGESS